MPFKTHYNEMIADKLHQINLRYAQHFPSSTDNYLNLGITADTDGWAPLRSSHIGAGSGIFSRIKDAGKNIYNESKAIYNKPLSRGLHYGSKIAEHYGYGEPESESDVEMQKPKRKGRGNIADMLGLAGNLAGYTPIPYLDKGLNVGSTLARFAGLGKPKKPKSGAGIFSNIAHGVGDISGAFGLGKKSKKCKKGAGIFSNIAHGVGDVSGMFGLGKSKKGGAQFATASDSDSYHTMPADRNTMRGVIGGKSPSKRAALVKQIMKKNGCSMIEASSFIKKNNLYKK